MSIELSNESGVELDEAELQRLLGYAMAELYIHPDADIALLMVDEQAMSVLHEQWMDEPGPTDVLSFPMDELRPGSPDELTGSGILGDIVLCPSVAEKQALIAGHSSMAELKLLTVHGLLHLLGYDHAEEEEHKEMFGLQDQLLKGYEQSRSEI